MTFRRSDSGLSNHHLFHSVHIMMYVEGGADILTFQEIDAVSGSSTTLDAAYWRGILQSVGVRKRIRVVSIGCKSTLLDIARAIADGRVRNVYVGVDRDFGIDAVIAGVPGVMHTVGYSWENDVWNYDAFMEVVRGSCPQVEITPEFEIEVRKEVESFYKAIGWSAAADRALALNGLERDFLSRPGKVLTVVEKCWPQLTRKLLGQLLAEARIRLANSGARCSMKGVDPQRDCYGKLVALYYYFMFVCVLQRNNVPSQVSKQLVNGAAISIFVRRLMAGALKGVSDHFKNQLTLAGAI